MSYDITPTPLSLLDGDISYLAQWLLMVCRQQRQFQNADMTLFLYWSQRSGSNILTYLIALNSNSYFSF